MSSSINFTNVFMYITIDYRIHLYFIENIYYHYFIYEGIIFNKLLFTKYTYTVLIL